MISTILTFKYNQDSSLFVCKLYTLLSAECFDLIPITFLLPFLLNKYFTFHFSLHPLPACITPRRSPVHPSSAFLVPLRADPADDGLRKVLATCQVGGTDLTRIPFLVRSHSTVFCSITLSERTSMCRSDTWTNVGTYL